MTSNHKLCAILLACMTAGYIATLLSRHADCIAFCTNIANSGP
ncbi:hypothetical protein [Mesorhizobium sp. M2D.F.Ca.ET.232.01.1.1]|nr:hypothetical protein [Mesorhizobium sp. M2D.F.Ca.ET.232.01.1.1]